MSDDSTTQCWLFPDLFAKPLVARFDQEHGSSDGGALLLKAADRRYGGLLARLAACVPDPRQADRVEHTMAELFAQRVYGMACGYADGNDAARLRRIRCTSCWRGGIRCAAAIWPRNRRCRALRTRWVRAICTGWAKPWPTASSSGTRSGWADGRGR